MACSSSFKRQCRWNEREIEKKSLIPSRKRQVDFMFSCARPGITSKKVRSTHFGNTKRSSSIKDNFCLMMPYGCEYDEKNSKVSFFNEDFNFIGTQDRFTFDMFPQSKKIIFYEKKVNHPTTDVHNMLKYIEELPKYEHCVHIVRKHNTSSSEYDVAENYFVSEANHYKSLLFGALYVPFRRIDQDMYS